MHYLIGQRVITGAAGERPPGPVTSIGKLYFCPLVEDIADFGLELDRSAGSSHSPKGLRSAADGSGGCGWRTRPAALRSPAARPSSSATSSPSASSACRRAEIDGVNVTTTDGIRRPTTSRGQRDPAGPRARPRRYRRAAGALCSPTSAWYWDAVATDLGSAFRTPYSRVLDLRNGIEHPDWFVDGTTERRRLLPAALARMKHPDRVAVVHEAEAGQIRELTFDELATEVARAAARTARARGSARATPSRSTCR